jgi:1-acyl-sn-glycerol-3-phosphate acyltransferase
MHRGLRPNRFTTALATFSGNLFLIVGSLTLSSLSILVSRIPPRTSWAFGCSRLWSWGLLKASGVRLDATLDPALDPSRSYVFLANHQSLFDIPALIASSPGQVRFLAKRSLFRIPFFGWALSSAGFIPVDREDRSSARHSFASAASRLAGGTSILIFPEGTRSLEEGCLLPFERGGFLLALKSGLPIVPVGIRGTRAIQPRRSFVIRPGVARVRYGAPLTAGDYGLRRKAELIQEVRRRICELAELPVEPSAEPALPVAKPRA